MNFKKILVPSRLSWESPTHPTETPSADVYIYFLTDWNQRKPSIVIIKPNLLIVTDLDVTTAGLALAGYLSEMARRDQRYTSKPARNKWRHTRLVTPFIFSCTHLRYKMFLSIYWLEFMVT